MAETITIQEIAKRWQMTPSAVLRLVKRQGVTPDVVFVLKKRGRPPSGITIVECKMIEGRVRKEQRDQLGRQLALFERKWQELERKRKRLDNGLWIDKKLERMQEKLKRKHGPS